MKKQSGIYEILNVMNGKRYIGSTADLARRKRHHWWLLNRVEHHSPHLQAAWNKYGEASFKFRVILMCAPTKEMLYFYEQQLFEKVKPEYNIAEIVGSSLGIKRCPETCEKISKYLTGRSHPPERCAAKSIYQTGLKRAPGVGGRISLALQGNKNALGCKRTPEQAKRIGDVHRGMQHTLEAKLKISRAFKGKPWTLARRAAFDKTKAGQLAPHPGEAA